MSLDRLKEPIEVAQQMLRFAGQRFSGGREVHLRTMQPLALHLQPAVLGAHQLRGRDLVVSDPPGTRRVSLDHLPISLSEVPAESAAGSTVAERVARWRDSGHEISVVELTTPDLRGATHVVRAVETVPRS